MKFIFSLLVLVFVGPSRGTLLYPATRIPDHEIWTKELEKFVSVDGLINYTEWKDHQENLDKYLQQLSKPLPLSNWSQNVQLAYWINLHNAYTVKLVLQHYPIQSLHELNEGDPWSAKWISIGDTQYSLEQIQWEIRSQYNDPRVNFALNKGTKSSAPILKEAYIPERLGEQLNAQTESFINNDAYNQFSESSAKLSPIFNLYKTDFKPDPLTFVRKYLVYTIATPESIDYFAFDWTLNDLVSE